MNDAEKLAIAEEIARPHFALGDVNLGDVCVNRGFGEVWSAYGSRPGVVLATSGCPYHAIYLARQKLAAEREAALPECAKKWRKALEEMVARDRSATELDETWYIKKAREALKE